MKRVVFPMRDRRPARIGLSFLVLAPLYVSAAGGCAGSTTRYVDVDSKPTGAVIYVDGERRGLTRSKVQLDFAKGPGQRVLIQIVKPRYKPVLQYWTEGEVPENEKRIFTLEVD